MIQKKCRLGNHHQQEPYKVKKPETERKREKVEEEQRRSRKGVCLLLFDFLCLLFHVYSPIFPCPYISYLTPLPFIKYFDRRIPASQFIEKSKS